MQSKQSANVLFDPAFTPSKTTSGFSGQTLSYIVEVDVKELRLPSAATGSRSSLHKLSRFLNQNGQFEGKLWMEMDENQ